MEELRQAFVKLAEQVRKIGRRFLARLREILEAIRPALHQLRGLHAREAWRRAHQTARFISRHPDIAEFDGYLDRWYPDPTFA